MPTAFYRILYRIRFCLITLALPNLSSCTNVDHIKSREYSPHKKNDNYTIQLQNVKCRLNLANYINYITNNYENSLMCENEITSFDCKCFSLNSDYF